MAPKKGTSAKKSKPDEAQNEVNKSEGISGKDDLSKTDAVTEAKASTKSKKRKAGTVSEAQGARKSARGAKSAPTHAQLLSFLLSEEALKHSSPEDDTSDSKLRTYSLTALNPWEELLSAVILSRPISHRLGMRAIRTVLNAPYSFNSAKATQTAGAEKQHQALWDARTQHKDKTAKQIGGLADVILDTFASTTDKEGKSLAGVHDKGGDEMEAEMKLLKSSIKGVGETGLNIFFRRVQWQWLSAYPNVDGKTADSLRKLGLPQDPSELVELITANWKALKKVELAGADEGQRKRRAYVMVLERAVGTDLEGNIEAVIDAAAKVSA
ncbi:hypothetical protein B0A48_10542 [Cryoendolithus antarcticus]|uniref:Uncharacterized protein n=1 Tax=Cryoendolithus antarcticus TaxID=1507870 RepID=A0A1V8SXV5_9PEZI|nr:hypothetical protein B0A48_10542 [Cryoendolithus antarcticus]